MNRLRNIIIIIAMIVLVGCSNSTSNHSKETEETTTNVVVLPTAPESPVEDPLIHYDPNREIYITFNNMDSDIYTDSSMMPSQNFSILSRSYIEPEEIEITIPIETDYAVQVVENTAIHTTDYLNSIDNPEKVSIAFPYYLYQCYRNTDWNKMLQLYREAEEANKKISELLKSGTSTTDSEYIKQKEIVEEYYAYRDLYLEDYKALTPEDLPVIYAYDVTIWFGASKMPPWGADEDISNNKVSESFQTIEIQIGDEIYVQDIGEIRLHEERLPQLDDTIEDLASMAQIRTGMPSYPWGDGIQEALEWVFFTKKDITISNMYLYEQLCDVELLGAHVTLSGASTMDFYWDLNMPFEIKAGTQVYIHLIFKDVKLRELEYGARVFPIMEYEVEGQQKKTEMECILDRYAYTQLWLRYAVVFDGLDVESYFEDFYRPVNESWREELPW